MKQQGFTHAEELLRRFGADHPRHLRAQYQGLRKLLGKYDVQLWEEESEAIMALPVLSCTRLERLFKIKIGQLARVEAMGVTPDQSHSPALQNSFRDLSYYDRLVGSTKHD